MQLVQPLRQPLPRLRVHPMSTTEAIMHPQLAKAASSVSCRESMPRYIILLLCKLRNSLIEKGSVSYILMSSASMSVHASARLALGKEGRRGLLVRLRHHQ